MNKNFKKSIIIFSFFTVIIGIVLISIISFYNYKYTTNSNKVLTIILNKINTNGSIKEEEIIDVINSEEPVSNDFLQKYGIDIKETEIIKKNETLKKKELSLLLVILFIYFLIIIFIFFKYYTNERKKINDITKCIKRINNHDYGLEIDKNEEGELSSLKNELYKTALVLNEQNNRLKEDKKILKDSLSDISHQLKTPLTSIKVMLENILEDKKMEEKVKKEFIKDIYRKTTNINFLVLELLKLSRFDAETITFNRQKNNIKMLLNKVSENVSVLCDLKNITINIKGNFKSSLICDEKWQIEALTNIVKNCIEHSSNNSIIDLIFEENDLFTKIIIKDYGEGISENDLPHIFERFYKCSNYQQESIGIGLSLAKTIIEKDNGYIYVKSQIGKGTEFIIKYLK